MCGRFDPTVCRLFLQAAETGQPSPELLALLRAHSPAPLLTDLRAPTYLVQGMSDTLFGLEHADATARTLQAQGTPVAVRWIDGGHDGPSSTAEADEAALRAFLAGALASRLGIAAVPGFVYAVPVPRRQSIAPLFSMPAYPGLAQANRSTVALASGGPRALLNPPGGQPAALTTLAGATIPGGAGAAYQLASLPGQSVAFDTQQLESRRDLAGSPRVRLTVTSTGTSVTLFLSLWQVTGDAATLARKLVAPVTIPTTPGQPATVDIDLPAATWTVEAGSRLRLLVSTTDTAYAGPRAARADQISIVGAALDLPALDGTRLPGESDRDTEALGVAGALLAVLAVWGVTAYLARRRRTHLPERSDLVGVPLVVDGLVKTYADGHRAVDDVSWRADRGQVVGLLGPNGAGKTTTLRMVLGLIAADEGQSYLNGVPVQPGSRALRHIGALVEGPGFLPHLTGRQNLHAFWAATGRDPAESHLEDVLDVAALGGAIDRPVRSYSHGMKQRLGIAQAMLGLPDLLILDEPTNGLDPPQIAAMRPMLQRYAAAGRTVVVSSHLLAEVEQTCSHVVVMHAGRVVTSGTVAELVDSADTTVVWLDPQTPRDAVGALAGRLRAHSGVAGVEVVADEGEPRLVVTAGMPRADLVRLLTDEGADIVGLSSRRHLEEAFLGVIAAAGDAELGRRRSRSTAGRTPGSTAGSTPASTSGSTSGARRLGRSTVSATDCDR
ncbi:MAG: ATP-binding cassette domain-containing protein [Actinomycetales bacterium]|nr:ATP-binding cassette domain-containing protein [Actinomycetales bacterium]